MPWYLIPLHKFRLFKGGGVDLIGGPSNCLLKSWWVHLECLDILILLAIRRVMMKAPQCPNGVLAPHAHLRSINRSSAHNGT